MSLCGDMIKVFKITRNVSEVGLLNDYFFNCVNRAINYFNRALIAVLTHISFVLCYRCRGVPEMCGLRIRTCPPSRSGVRRRESLPEAPLPQAFHVSHVRERTRTQPYLLACVRGRPDTDASF